MCGIFLFRIYLLLSLPESIHDERYIHPYIAANCNDVKPLTLREIHFFVYILPLYNDSVYNGPSCCRAEPYIVFHVYARMHEMKEIFHEKRFIYRGCVSISAFCCILLHHASRGEGYWYSWQSKNGKLLASTPYRLLYGGYTRERLHGQTDGQTNDKRTDLRRFLTEYLQ